MAMLAEPRRKQKLSIDPRNRSWSDDQSKFGQRMLEKMGWKNGKGLGANEDGKTDHIKVSLKNNSLGVGCSASHEDNWIAHQDDFNDILANLNQDHGNEEGQDDDKKDTEETVKSLEERSKKSKRRVHYKKFTRGKDLSRYGTTDINCILGVRANRSASSTPKMQSINNSEDDDDGDDDDDGEEKEDTSHGITTIIHNTSMQDYFAKKMADLKKARQLQQQNIDNNNQARESEERSNQSDDSLESKNKKSKKKKKNKRKKDLDDSQDCDISHLEVEREDIPAETKKLKKRKQRDVYNGKVSSEGNGLGDKSSSSEEAQNSDGTPRKKKCKRKNKRKELEEVTVGDDSEQTNISGFVSKKSKKKKKKSKCKEIL